MTEKTICKDKDTTWTMALGGPKQATGKLSEAQILLYMYMVFYSVNITYIKLYPRD
jgi:hypothetical protein